MRESGLGSQAIALLNARLGDVPVALGRESHPAPKPLLLAEFKNFLQRVATRIVAEGEAQLGGREATGSNLLDETIHHCPGERIAINHFTFQGQFIGTKWSGGQAYNLGVRETAEHLLPTGRGGVVALVNEDKVKEVRWELREPTIRRASELLDVRDDEVTFSAVVDIGIRAVQNREVGAILEVSQNARLGPKTLPASDIEGGSYAFSDRQVWGYYEDAPGGDTERKRCHDPGLPTTNGNLKDRWRLILGEVFADGSMCVLLRLTEQFIGLDVRVCALEQLARIG